MTRLSVNINKIATIRNARGGQLPDLVKAAINIEQYGAQGITIHPRPDERHIRYQDVKDLKPVVSTEFNIEGYPSEYFINLVLEIQPDQVTLVPDPPEVLTSNAGWNTIENKDMLTDVIKTFKSKGIRTSLFIETDDAMIEGAASVGSDRVELYTESYATRFKEDRKAAVLPFIKSAHTALECDLGINAGHDLNLENLRFFSQEVPGLLEVSIGHALISDALYYGLENTVQLYLRELRKDDNGS